jgi:methyl-accepting chemotaxis protein-1 (serine sensor receptor)
MDNMNAMSIKKQMALAFGVLAAIVALISALALRDLGQVNDRLAGYIAGPGERAALASAVRSAASQRAIAVRNLVLVKSDGDRAAETAEANSAHQRVQTELQSLQKAVTGARDATDRDRAMVAEIERIETTYAPVALAIVQLAQEGKRDQAIDKMNNECRPLLAALIKASSEYVAYVKEQAKENVAGAASDYLMQRNTLFAVNGAAIVSALVLGWWITRRLIVALGAEPAELGSVAQRVAEGDLSPVQGADRAPPGSVLASMGAMQHYLVSLIGQVRAAAESIATSSAQIAQGNHDLSGRTERQASALQQTAASMEQFGSTVKQNAENARQANQLAQAASTVAIQGGGVVGQVVDTMKGINDSSKQIADIISVIDGIAFQTNILALNAAVEAARAGEQGRGFAVVAGEVRTLAQRSAEAAREIKSLITASVARVEQGTNLVDQAGATMSEVVDSIRRVTDIVSEISAASTEQSSGVTQVGDAVTQMDQTTQQNAALVEQSAAAAASMQRQAEELVRAIGAFKLVRGADRPLRAPAPPVPGTAARRQGEAAQRAARPAPKATATAQAPAERTAGADNDWTEF